MGAFGGPTGLRGPTDPTGQYAGHTTSIGGAGSTYQGASSDYANRGPIAKVIGALTPFGVQKPSLNQPSTYTNGLSHYGFNPVSLAGAIGGLAVPGLGVAGQLGGMAYNALGGKNVVTGSASPGPVGPETHDYSGASSPGGNPGGSPGGGYGQHGGGFGNFIPPSPQTNPMAAFGAPTTLPRTPTVPDGIAPHGNVNPVPQGGPGTGIGIPPPGVGGIANHSLPQGYASLFPNSLTAQDKARLYGQKLMGLA